MAVEPSQLVLGLLSSTDTQQTSAAMLARAAELFGFAPGTIRVTLTRLKQRGTIRAVGRGVYALGPRAAAVQREVALWRLRSESVVGWNGDWVMVSTTGLSRGDRGENRRRARTLSRAGFAEAAPGLEIRANNRRETLEQTRAWLDEIAPPAPAFLASDLPPTSVERALAIWNPKALMRRYRALSEELTTAERALPDLPVDEAAALSFDVGDRAIRAIVADPLLPPTFIDTEMRDRFFAAMGRFDDLGKEIWSRLTSEVTA